MDDKVHHMPPWGEIQGTVNKIEEVEGSCIALIGKISVILPPDMIGKLREVNGKRISILRTDFDYRFRIL